MPKADDGGHLVKELLEDGEYILANNSAKTTGGPWSWVCWGNGNVRSCINLVIMSTDLVPHFTSMVIDHKHEFCPFRIKATKDGKMRVVHPDHFPLIVKLENLRTQRIKVE